MTNNYLRVPFSQVRIGQEFLWGSFTPERSNWGQKRSTKTAVYRPRLSGQLAEWEDWGYWRQTESVFIEFTH